LRVLVSQGFLITPGRERLLEERRDSPPAAAELGCAVEQESLDSVDRALRWGLAGEHVQGR